MNKCKTRTFPRLFHNHQMHLLALYGLLQTEMALKPEKAILLGWNLQHDGNGNVKKQ